MGRILVSACLAGVNCKYSGGHNLVPAIAELVAKGKAVPVCPENLGGLKIPRPPAEIQGGNGRDVLAGRARVVDKEGKDVTAAFLRGAAATLAKAREIEAELVVLKEKAPRAAANLSTTAPLPAPNAQALVSQRRFSGSMVSGLSVRKNLLCHLHRAFYLVPATLAKGLRSFVHRKGVFVA